MSLDTGEGIEGTLKKTNLGVEPKINREKENVKKDSLDGFNIKDYLLNNMVKVDTENKNFVLEVLKYPVTQELYHQYDPDKVFKMENPNFPADEIRWIDAIGFCNWLSKKENKKPCYKENEEEETGLTYWSCDESADGYRLPSKVDWFFVAKEGNHNSNFKFSGSSRIENVAWYGGNSHSELHEVGQKNPNKLGLYDLSGNVMEFCWDKYKSSPERIACGGSAISDEELCMVNMDNSLHFKDGVPSPFVGFRLFRYINN